MALDGKRTIGKFSRASKILSQNCQKKTLLVTWFKLEKTFKKVYQNLNSLNYRNIPNFESNLEVAN